MDLRQQYYLQTIGIQQWVLRKEETSDCEPEVNLQTPASVQNCASLDWDELQLQVRDCVACELHKTRKQTVFGVGNRNADWLIIGEAPGADEDAQGEPFVGRAGQLLNNMLKAIGMQRQDVFIANILKCRPPQNRDPQPDEVEQCSGYLKRQVQLISPKIILAVGRIAAQNLLHTDQTIGRLRGTVHTLPELNVPVVVTYHPAYLLRKPSEKRKAWHDLLLAYNAWKKTTT